MAGEEALPRRRVPARSGEPADGSQVADGHRRSGRSAARSPRSRSRAAASTSRRRWATIESRGPATSALILIDSKVAVGRGQETVVFDGIDTTIPGIARLAGLPDGALRAELQSIDAAAKRALDEDTPTASDADRADARATAGAPRAPRARQLKTRAAPADARRPKPTSCWRSRRAISPRRSSRAAGVVDRPAGRRAKPWCQGGRFGVTVRAFLPDGSPVKMAGATVTTPAGWTVEPAAPPAADAGQRLVARFVPRGSGHAPKRVQRDRAGRRAARHSRTRLEAAARGRLYKWTDDAPRDSRSIRRW